MCGFDFHRPPLILLTECRLVWLSRSVWGRKIVGSNPTSPTKFKKENKMITNPYTELHFDRLIENFEETRKGIRPFTHLNFSFKEEEEQRSWKFKSASFEDIEFGDIVDSLTYKDPLALITRTFKNGYEVFVAINDKLLMKSVLVEERLPSSLDKIAENVYELNNTKSFTAWVDWAKRVKMAKWPNGEKSDVEVVLPTI